MLNECLISDKPVIKTRQNLTSTFLDQNPPNLNISERMDDLYRRF